MSERLISLACDRKFICPRCTVEVSIGGALGMFLPSKSRYCEPCAFAVQQAREAHNLAKLDAAADMKTTAPKTPPAGAYDLKPSDGKPRLPTAADKTDYVERYIHAKLVDKVFDLEKQLLEMQNQLKALDARVESLE